MVDVFWRFVGFLRHVCRFLCWSLLDGRFPESLYYFWVKADETLSHQALFFAKKYRKIEQNRMSEMLAVSTGVSLFSASILHSVSSPLNLAEKLRNFKIGFR
jgi:hypothetical protein